MIGDAIMWAVQQLLDVVRGVLDAALGLLPDIAPPDLQGMVAATAPVWGSLGWLNKYAPVDQAAIALGLYATWWLVLYLVRLGVWIATKLHLLGGE